MPTHKFKVGQMVEFTPVRSAVPVTARAYQVMRLQPLDGGLPTYRIKCNSEAFERIAKESELKRRV